VAVGVGVRVGVASLWHCPGTCLWHCPGTCLWHCPGTCLWHCPGTCLWHCPGTCLWHCPGTCLWHCPGTCLWHCPGGGRGGGGGGGTCLWHCPGTCLWHCPGGGRGGTCLWHCASRIGVVIVVVGVVVVRVENWRQGRNRHPVRGWRKTRSGCWLRVRRTGFRRCGWNSQCKESSNNEKYEQYPLWPSWCVPRILLVPITLGHNIAERDGLSPHSRHEVITSTLRALVDGAINPRKHETAHLWPLSLSGRVDLPVT
jgi:hypothetical protein